MKLIEMAAEARRWEPCLRSAQKLQKNQPTLTYLRQVRSLAGEILKAQQVNPNEVQAIKILDLICDLVAADPRVERIVTDLLSPLVR